VQDYEHATFARKKRFLKSSLKAKEKGKNLREGSPSHQREKKRHQYKME